MLRGEIIGVFTGLTRFAAAFFIIPIVSTLLFLSFAIPVIFKLFGGYILAGFLIYVAWKSRKTIVKYVKLIPSKI